MRSWAGRVALFMQCVCFVVALIEAGSLSGRCAWSVVLQQERAEGTTWGKISLRKSIGGSNLDFKSILMP